MMTKVVADVPQLARGLESSVIPATPIPLVYIAGPFRGPTPYDVRRNVEAARDAGLYVARLGAFPIIPHTMTADFDKQLTDEFWIRGHLQLLARCDAIYLIADWRRSAGAKAERAEAIKLEIPCYALDEYADTLLPRWIAGWLSAW